MTNTSCHVFYLWLFPFPKWPPTSWRAIPSCRRYLSCLCSLEGGYTLSRLAPLSTSHHACSSPSALHLCCSSSSFPWGEMRLLFEYYCKWTASNCMYVCVVFVCPCVCILYIKSLPALLNWMYLLSCLFLNPDHGYFQGYLFGESKWYWTDQTKWRPVILKDT